MVLEHGAVLMENASQWRRFKHFCKNYPQILLPRAKIDTYPMYVSLEESSGRLIVVPNITTEEVKTLQLFVLSFSQFKASVKEEGEKA